MGKIYFACSDIHSFYMPFKDALYRAGFRKTNPDHHLIICGDIFDRGDDSIAVYNYIKSIPKHRRTLIRGNHETLLLECIEKPFPDSYDFSNGTIKTICHIVGLSENTFDKAKRGEDHLRFLPDEGQSIYSTWRFACKKAAESPIIKWIKSKEWINFYEVDNYIFVHSFIAANIKSQYHGMNPFYIPDYEFIYNKDWRTDSTDEEWNAATWGCPYRKFDGGLFDQEADNGKILVCGHWTASDFHTWYDFDTYNHSTYFSKNLIALDACTAYTHDVNVLVLKDGTCYEKLNGAQLAFRKEYPRIETVSIEEM